MDNLALAIIVTLIATISVGFSLLSVSRLRSYIQAYSFDKEQYRPLFGFLHLRLMMWAYVFITLLLAGFFIVFLIFTNT